MRVLSGAAGLVCRAAGVIWLLLAGWPPWVAGWYHIALLLMLLVLWLVNWSMRYHRHQCPARRLVSVTPRCWPRRCPSVCRCGPPDPDWFHPADKRCTACTGCACAAYG
ncbi:hypothetical protein KCP78_25660 [Salmonella enterica subsp. enterica]|nr:hypothetical protein KCP78_25660 [Salmonella enterica subsp. enterica]